jgi:hypothetical protein
LTAGHFENVGIVEGRNDGFGHGNVDRVWVMAEGTAGLIGSTLSEPGGFSNWLPGRPNPQ